MTQIRSIHQIANDLAAETTERKKKGGVDLLGIPTGLDIIDNLTGGMQPDQLWIVAARTSVGKTGLALDIALSAAQDGRNVHFFSLEMRGEILVNRLLSRMSGIAAGRIIRGKYDDTEAATLDNCVRELSQFDIDIVDTTMTSQGIVDVCEARDKKIDLVVVDYVGILSDKNTMGDVQRLNEISQNLRALARPDYLNAPVLALSQLNRETESNEGNRPKISNIRGSGAFEHDAEVVILPHRPQHYEALKGAEPKEVEDDAELILGKNRNGPTGSTPAKFYPQKQMWEQKIGETKLKRRKK